jgi:hypothetical protein
MDPYASISPDILDSESQKNIDKYLCPVCQLIPYFQGAMEETNCGHFFCATCMVVCEQKGNKCPFCKATISSRIVQKENELAYKTLINLIVKCQHENCKWKGPWNDLAEHLDKEHHVNSNEDTNKELVGDYDKVYKLNEYYLCKVHPHLLKYVGLKKGGWMCDAIMFNENQCGLTAKEYDTSPRFRCDKCDFDICAPCMVKNFIIKRQEYTVNNEYNCKEHEHPLKYMGVTEEEWKCGANALTHNCITETTGTGEIITKLPRFKCENCDFNMCINCFEFYSNCKKIAKKASGVGSYCTTF